MNSPKQQAPRVRSWTLRSVGAGTSPLSGEPPRPASGLSATAATAGSGPGAQLPVCLLLHARRQRAHPLDRLRLQDDLDRGANQW